MRRVTFPIWELALLSAGALLSASNINNTILFIFCSFKQGFLLGHLGFVMLGFKRATRSLVGMAL